MNGQPPPTDPYLHDQLARRSGGRLPPGLVADVMAAVDGISVEKPGRSALRFALSPTRRTLAAGASLAVVAAMAVALVAVPLLRQPPTGGPTPLAGYPADRALTTAELARIMAGPALPTNTAIVAAVTIDTRSDVCPMNRYPTLGVIEGAGSQICVMAGTLAALSSGDLTTGTFAFRYLGPGYLGLLARIAPASSSRLAFGVTDSWLQNGDAVLVEGYLGTTPQTCDAAETPIIGDVLDPTAYEACSWSWLSEDGSPAPVLNVPTPDLSSTASPRPSIDTLALTGKARHVWVGGARQIDSISTTTTHGVYVVRVATGPCPGALPIDSYGCAFWSVVAKVPYLTLDEPVVTPSTGPAGYPAERALTTTELGQVLDSAEPTQYQILVVADAKVSAAPAGTCAEIDTTKVAGFQPAISGVVEGLDPPACVYGAPAGGFPSGGLTALRVLGSRQLGYMNTITPAAGRLAFKATDQWPKGYLLVDAWLDFDAADCGQWALPAFGGPQPLAPSSYQMCHAALSDSQPPDRPTPESASPGATGDGSGPIPTYPVPADGKAIDAAPYFELKLHSRITGSVHRVFLVQYDPRCSNFNKTDCEAWHLLGAVDPIGLSTVTPSPGPSSSPDKPVQPSPSLASGAALPGLAGSGGRPLTQVEFVNAWAADPDHLAGRIVITKGPIPSGFTCTYLDSTTASASPGTCQAILPMGEIAADGYWAVNVGADGRLSIVGELTLDPTGRFVWSLDSVNQSASAGDLVLVDGWLLATLTPGCETVETPRPSSCGPYSILSTAATENVEHSVGVQRDAYFQITGKAGDYLTGGATPVHGIILVRLDSNVKGALLAGFDLSYPTD